ncbi:MAG TPA: hypothetical protein VMF30_03850 [Pirellulales bacterium]|nr:hypothetical protein [Pirellulales bacterium]
MRRLLCFRSSIRCLAFSQALVAAVAWAAPPVTAPTSDSVTIESPPAGAVNLLANGDFETPNAAGDGPAHWQPLDNLVFHWVRDSDPARGRVMRIETDVGQPQAYAWWKKLFQDKAPLREAPVKIPDTGYSSIGGLDGGFYASDLIPIRAGGAYKVYIDAKGPVSKVFIRGYEKEVPLSFGDEQPAVQEMFATARGEPSLTPEGKARKHRLRYAYQTWFAVGGSDTWQTYTHRQPRHPNGRELTEDVRWIRIQLYPYWPPAAYEFDNIRVIEVPALDRQGKPAADEADVEEGKVVK